MYCFYHCTSFISRVYYRCVNKHTASVGGYCMTQKHKKSPPLPIYTMLTLAIVGLLASACALLGGSSSSTTSATSTPSARPSNAHPFAGQPVPTGKLPPANPLPANQPTPLLFDLLYNH